MKNKESLFTHGFTLAEIIVSLLLLSILAIGSFQTFLFAQASSNSNLDEFQNISLKKQLFSINKLENTYSNISASDEFESLNCLIESEAQCP